MTSKSKIENSGDRVEPTPVPNVRTPEERVAALLAVPEVTAHLTALLESFARATEPRALEPRVSKAAERAVREAPGKLSQSTIEARVMDEFPKFRATIDARHVLSMALASLGALTDSPAEPIPIERIRGEIDVHFSEEAQEKMISGWISKVIRSCLDAISLPAGEEARAVKEQYVRLLADFDNYRKRVERDREDTRRRGLESLLRELLPVFDAFDHADTEYERNPSPEVHREGFRQIQRLLMTVLEKAGLTEIEAQEDFDPNIHEPICEEPHATLPAGKIIAVVRRGFRLGTVVVRPVLVRVSQGPPQIQANS